MEIICSPTSDIHNMPFEIKPESVGRAIVTANLIGEEASPLTLY
jgi:hypothetical protein